MHVRVLTTALATFSVLATVLILEDAKPALADVAVDLELVLAVDVSGSVDDDEAALQRRGYVAALTDPEVVAAIQSGLVGRIAVTYVEWAGESHQLTVAQWAVVEDAASAGRFAATIAGAPPLTAWWTSISGLLDFVLPQFAMNGFSGARRAIDISGDGPNNNGGPVTEARDRVLAAGVTINGLPIVNDKSSPYGWPALPHLDLYYEDCVIGGPGAFLIVAESFEDFAAAIRRKLILEIAGTVPPAKRLQVAAAGGVVPARSYTDLDRPDCLVGERRLKGFMEREF